MLKTISSARKLDLNYLRSSKWAYLFLMFSIYFRNNDKLIVGDLNRWNYEN